MTYNLLAGIRNVCVRIDKTVTRLTLLFEELTTSQKFKKKTFPKFHKFAAIPKFSQKFRNSQDPTEMKKIHQPACIKKLSGLPLAFTDFNWFFKFKL